MNQTAREWLSISLACLLITFFVFIVIRGCGKVEGLRKYYKFKTDSLNCAQHRPTTVSRPKTAGN